MGSISSIRWTFDNRSNNLLSCHASKGETLMKFQNEEEEEEEHNIDKCNQDGDIE
jgi:hypothetical protein